MNLSIGIVGLPNVGKSTLFNALLKKQVALAANYPFATIEPNVGVVEVPDERLEKLAGVIAGDPSTSLRMTRPPVIPAAVQFYDIAGLVKGASTGEGLGNKFLSHIREVAAIAHVTRLFEDPNVTHVSDKINPQTDIETIESELILADLQTLQKQKEPRGTASKEEQFSWELMQKLKTVLDKGTPARQIDLSIEEQKTIKQLNLLTMKPVIYVFNVSEEQLENQEELKKNVSSFMPKVSSNIEGLHDSWIYLCAKLETEIVALSADDQQEYLKQYALSESGLNRLIKKAYETLGLISFLTAGEKEVRAWTIKSGALAPQAAGVIHTDFEKHFIKAEVVPFPLFVELGGWVKCRDAGKVTLAGKDYVMKDGDVVDFKVGI